MNLASPIPPENAGLFGIALRGVHLPAHRLTSPPSGTPTWALIRESTAASQRPARPSITDTVGTFLHPQNVWTVIDRSAHTITAHTPRRVTDDAILHPFGMAAFSTAARWRGASVFHAGAVILGGRAWGLLGGKGAGKSTTSLALSGLGHPVLSDDVLIVEDGQVLAGPRFTDLRHDAPGAEDLGVVGLRRRWRLPLPAAPWSAPLGGWFVLDWGAEFSSASVPAPQRFSALLDAYSFSDEPIEPRALLELSGRTMLRVTRPRDVAQLEAFGDYLAELATAAAAA